MSFPFFISQKPGEVPILKTFLAKFPILAYVLLKIGYFEVWTYLRHILDVCTSFGMYEKRRPLAILWYQLNVSGGSVFKFTGGGNPLGKPCYRKRLGKTRVNPM